MEITIQNHSIRDIPNKPNTNDFIIKNDKTGATFHIGEEVFLKMKDGGIFHLKSATFPAKTCLLDVWEVEQIFWEYLNFDYTCLFQLNKRDDLTHQLIEFYMRLFDSFTEKMYTVNYTFGEKNKMGYTTDFDGEFQLDKPLLVEHYNYLLKFSETRRMCRNAEVAENLPDETREMVGLPIGPQGCFFVGGTGPFGQDRDKSIIDFNRPPVNQPGLWCKWEPNDAGTTIRWNGAEKFYNYVEWLEYLIRHFLGPWGYKLNGAVRWQGEEIGDIGTIFVKNNIISKNEGVAISDPSKDPNDLQRKMEILQDALKEIVDFKKAPIRRNQYAGKMDYKAPDWIQTKDAIFKIAERALKEVEK